MLNKKIYKTYDPELIKQFDYSTSIETRYYKTNIATVKATLRISRPLQLYLHFQF